MNPPKIEPSLFDPKGEGEPAALSGRPLLKEHAFAVLVPVLIALVCRPLVPFTGYMLVGLVFLLGVVMGALRLSHGPLLLMTVFSALVWDFFFIPPIFTLRVEKLDDMVIIAMFFIMAFNVYSSLLRTRYLMEHRQRRQTAALLHLTQKVAFSVEPAKGMAEALHIIGSLFHAECAVVLWTAGEGLSGTCHAASAFQPSAPEWETIRWSFEHRQPAGRFTGWFSDSQATWFPLQTSTAAVGVLGVLFPERSRMEFNSRQMLEALALQLALVLEKEDFLRAVQQTEVLEASEQLRRTLLDSVSHELKTPLAALQAATDELEHDPGQASRYVPELRAAQRRLRRTVDNLLSMSRLESGAAKAVMDWCDVDQVCEAALGLVGDALSGHAFTMDVPVELPMVRMDEALIEQALANLLLNAATHTPPDSEVMLRARLEDRTLVLSVLDRGPGIPPGEMGKLFQKFARGESAPAGSSGLGLAIARGFAQAHNGTATAKAREGGGTVFSLALPVETLQRDLHENGPIESAHH